MSVSKQPHLAIENQILTAMTMAEYQRLAPHLEQVQLEVGQVLYKANEPITHVYFPHQSIVSLVSTQKNGLTVEAGIVGNDGIVGVSVILGSNTTNTTAFVQISGSSLMMKTELLIAEFNRGGELQGLLLRYTHRLLIQVTQTLACNTLHSIERRLARWLLFVADRVQSDTFFLTQEYIAKMLGCRRTGVTEVANRLSRAGMISYKRGTINILNRSGLEDKSCECYSMIKDEYARLLSVPSQPALDKGSRERENHFPLSLHKNL
ncbi:Crp/Fnr family transcriptional regulator [Nostoc flagelliforme FACHB-838]|uniref:Crp/Fnr family transcriptional regulator n=1 Tax=Nostoc flagelliforme FACHB-838 TaxID=2692904 RepID=A0ABR8DRK0_9NOSO|nr:Crp/Fnr family transcriptional regulator [Nostoc flagelliforme]MBD2531521.1 Crp/Fnr family transcriptional regulator [Nostoc flagelliforme FACHB-838]